MKHLRKLITFAIVLAMVMAFMVPTAMAAEITVTNVLEGETYTAYKILNYSSNATDSTAATTYSYYLTKAEYDTGLGAVLTTAGFVFEETSDGTQYIVTNTAALQSAGADAMVAALKLADLSKALAKVEATATADGQAVFTNLSEGYYFVTSSLGSLCTLASYDDQALIVEKNSQPTIDKKQSASDADYADADLDLNIGDTVYYQIAITDGKGTNEAIVVTDTMTAGISIVADSISVTKGDTAVDTANYTLTSNDNGFVLTLTADYVADLAESDIVTVKYSATVNSSAAIDSATNTNTAKMEYSEQEQTDIVKLSTYDFVVKKTDGTNALSGAKFKLYDDETGGNEIKLAKDATGYYVSATGTEEIDAGNGTGVNIRGLKPGTYYLEETVAPEGYNKLDKREAVTIQTGATAAVEVTVVNQAGTVLPSTGGMGTTLFYIVGGLMVVGALVVLVTNKRMRAE